MADDKRVQRIAGAVRQGDIEPYTALRWVSGLFKGAAIFLLVALIGEFIAGLRFQGLAALSVLLGEAARTFVLSVVLWGGGDLVRLLVHLGHDIRAERILLARLVHRLPTPPGGAPEDQETEEAVEAAASTGIEPPRHDRYSGEATAAD